jgi:cytochrome c peroxidase
MNDSVFRQLGLPYPTFPAGVPPSAAEVRLGAALFTETALSADGKVSCETCHGPANAFAEHKPVSIGVFNRKGVRNAPTLLNAAYMDRYAWDGEHNTLEEQALSALLNPNEMALLKTQIAERVEPKYGARLRELYGSVSAESVAKALGAFQRTLISGDSPFDRYLYGGQQDAISDSAKRGFKVFLREGRCVLCHTIRCDDCHPFGGKLGVFTDNRMHNIGVGFDKNGDTSDWGRWNLTHVASDRGTFKTPTLRNVALTAPYMHDGSLATLEDVIEHYNKGGNPNSNLDPDIHPLHLSGTQKQDLVEFLKSLTSVALLQSPHANPDKTVSTEALGSTVTVAARN